jgi:NAD(P)-dependent dehydrogenase (short-subunit alcohol dehydrogenase family)
MTLPLVQELGAYKIRVNSIAPTVIPLLLHYM